MSRGAALPAPSKAPAAAPLPAVRAPCLIQTCAAMGLVTIFPWRRTDALKFLGFRVLVPFFHIILLLGLKDLYEDLDTSEGGRLQEVG